MGHVSAKIRAGYKKMLNFAGFLILLGFVFTRTTYLFRNCGMDREHVLGIQNEEKFDVVCIGGSSTFVYWEPYLAWKEYGMTSYNLATNSANPPVISGYTKYLLRMQKPELVVIDVRSFTGGTGTISSDEGPVRNMTDSLPLSIQRIQTVTDTLNYYNASGCGQSDNLSFYFDIAKYHNEYARLGGEVNWKYMAGRCKSRYKGFEFVSNPCHAVIKEPEDYRTKERAELDPVKEKSLKALLEELKKSHVNALFAAGPIPVSKDTQMQYNTISDITASYGCEFLNTNDYYEEMGLDFSKDFYNAGHVNVYGAEKYTRFTADFIKEHYRIADHRGDEAYEQWDADYLEAKEQEMAVKALINEQADAKEKANRAGKRLKTVKEDFLEWCGMAADENYTVLILSKGNKPAAGMPGRLWNITGGERELIRVCTGRQAVYESDAVLDEAYHGVFGSDNKGYEINCGEKGCLAVDGRQYDLKKDGIYILVFDNHYNQVLDMVRVSGKDKQGYVWEHFKKL